MFAKVKVLGMFVMALLLSACGGGSASSNSSALFPSAGIAGDLVSSQSIGEFPRNSNLAMMTFSALAGRAYGVEVIKLVYKTRLENGDLVLASGIIALPMGKNGDSPLLSYQHTTLFLDSAVPSNDPVIDMTPILTASAGFVSVAADYIGYGVSKALPHPYIQSVPSANSVIDLIRAARSYLAERNIGLNNQLFLAGYSEGGYASLAAHQRMETLYSDEFNVTANVVGGGPYDVRASVDETLLNQSRLSSPAYFGYLVHAYDQYYELGNLTLRAVTSPHHITINDAYDGNSSGTKINSVLPRSTNELFNDYFLADYASATAELRLKASLDANNVYAWAPKAPVLFYHGVNDELVPYSNALTAERVMNQQGAANVTLTDCAMQPSNHANCAVGFATFATRFLLDESAGR